jgi:hypothetical protein
MVDTVGVDSYTMTNPEGGSSNSRQNSSAMTFIEPSLRIHVWAREIRRSMATSGKA